MNFQDLKAEHNRKQSEKMLRENPHMPTGYCSCCGAPRIHGLMKHDRECIWWDKTNQPYQLWSCWSSPRGSRMTKNEHDD